MFLVFSASASGQNRNRCVRVCDRNRGKSDSTKQLHGGFCATKHAFAKPLLYQPRLRHTLIDVHHKRGVLNTKRSDIPFMGQKTSVSFSCSVSYWIFRRITSSTRGLLEHGTRQYNLSPTERVSIVILTFYYEFSFNLIFFELFYICVGYVYICLLI
jgi:hypothetical protein